MKQKPLIIFKIILSVVLLLHLCGFKTDTSAITNFFKEITSDTVSGCEIQAVLPTVKIIKTLERKDVNRLVKLLSSCNGFKPGKLEAVQGLQESITVYMPSLFRLTLIFSDKGCWFYFPSKSGQSVSSYQITQKDVLNYIHQLEKNYIIINKNPKNNTLVPIMKDIATAYFIRGGAGTNGIRHGRYVFDFGHADNRKLLFEMLEELRTAPIMHPIDNEMYAVSAGGTFSTFIIGLKDGRQICIKSACIQGKDQIYFDNQKLYSPKTKAFIDGGWENSKLRNIPVEDKLGFFNYKYSFLKLKPIPDEVVYMGTTYKVYDQYREDQVINEIGVTDGITAFKVYSTKYNIINYAIALLYSENPKVFVLARNLGEIN